jgi:uncharacterized membrane protein
MSEIYPIIRIIHVIAGSLWIGEVVVINCILIPVLSKFEGDYRRQFLVTLFPRIFNLASLLSATVVITGVIMVYYLTNGELNLLASGRWGLSILLGGILGIILTLFHFFMENRLASKIGLGKKGDHEKLAEVHLSLKIVPRLGLLVILAIFLLMINAAHGALRG